MNFSKWLSANWIAVYGAALSTVLATIRVLEWIQNRPRVIITPSLCLFSFSAAYTSGTSRAAIAFRAHNFGSRPTTLEAFFCIIPRKMIGVSGKAIESPIPGTSIRQDVPPLPARIDPGGIVTVYWDLNNFNQSPIPYALVGFRDARGREYYCDGGLKGWWIRLQARHRRH